MPRDTSVIQCDASVIMCGATKRLISHHRILVFSLTSTRTPPLSVIASELYLNPVSESCI